MQTEMTICWSNLYKYILFPSFFFLVKPTKTGENLIFGNYFFNVNKKSKANPFLGMCRDFLGGSPVCNLEPFEV
jgi:hypothetical protein